MKSNMKVFQIKAKSENSECGTCNTCLKMKFMEMGFIPDSFVKISNHKNGMGIVSFLDETGLIDRKLALRNEEIETLISKDQKCPIQYIEV